MYSKYNVYLNNYPKEGFTTIYNLLSEKIICYADRNLFPEPSTLIIDKLIDKGIYCKENSEEVLKSVQKYENIVNSKDELVFVILLTEKCNCKCTYCYEADLDLNFNKLYNNKEILAFISKKMEEAQTENLRVVFYGGEPLLEKEMITKLSIQLQNKWGRRYKFSIVTNGTLLQRNDVLRWSELGLTKIKVTLDGNRESHNLRRVLKSGIGSYDTIMTNLESVKHDVDIVINIVIDNEIFGVSQMIQDLKAREINATYSMSFKEPCTLSAKERMDVILRLNEIMLKENVKFQSSIKSKHGIVCPMKRKNYYVIDGKGNVYGCESNLLKSIGNIMTFISLKEYELKEKCKCCNFLPICYGECVHNSQCQKEYFSILLPKVLKLYIKTTENDMV